MRLKERVDRVEKRQTDAIVKAQSAFLASLTDDWLLEYVRLELHHWVSQFPDCPTFASLPASDRERLAPFGVADDWLVRWHAEPFTPEMGERLSALEQELIDGWRARGLPEAWLWEQ